MSKQDRAYPRTAADLERRYNFGKTFAEVYNLVTDAQKAAEDANKAVEDLDTKLDHEEVFNRLTNYGKVQGIYRGDNDEIYINASYIKSGTLAADLVDTKNLKVDAANITGELVIGQLPTNVAKKSDIPTLLSQLFNDSGYQTASGVTSIVGGVVTTDYVNALGITVDAANITGTLSADQVVLTGAITWGDLSADVQNTIFSQSADLPGYIKNTHIDATNVSTFHIKANKIEAVIPQGSEYDDDTGFILTGSFANASQRYLRIHSFDGASAPFLVFSSPMRANVTWDFLSTYMFGNIDFTGAYVTFDSDKVTGLHAKFV